MAINPKELQRLIADYNACTGNQAARFVCPILDQEIDVGELMNGHVINEALPYVQRTKVIQYGKIDGFYGTRTEAAFVRYMQLPFMSFNERFPKAEHRFVILPDGSEIEAFMTKGENTLPCLNIPAEDGSTTKIYLRCRNDDPRLKDSRNSMPVPGSPGEYMATKMPNIRMGEMPLYTPSLIAASAVKVAYLTDFYLRGYKVLFDPYMRPIREALRDYFLADGKPEDSPKYFEKFEYALRFLVIQDGGGGFGSLNENTIEHGVAWAHYSSESNLFGLSFVIPYRNIEFIFTMPHGDQHCDPSQVMADYLSFVRTEYPGVQRVLKLHFEHGAWKAEPKIWHVRFTEDSENDPSVFAHLNRIVKWDHS